MPDVQLDWEWEDADGTITTFNATNRIRVLDGVQGHEAPPRTIGESRLVGIDGSIVTNRRYESRDLIIPMSLFSTYSVGDTLGTLASAFANGPGILRYTTPKATGGVRTRELRRVEYVAGLEGNMTRGAAALDFLRQVTVGFRAFDPWWYGTTETLILALAGATVNTYNDAAVMYNDADVPYAGGFNTANVKGERAYTSVTFTGPADAGATLSLTGGTEIVLTDNLAVGEQIVVNSRPLNRGPRLEGGPVVFSLITPESEPFDFVQGDNELVFAASGTTVDSGLEVEWTNRYLTP